MLETERTMSPVERLVAETIEKYGLDVCEGQQLYDSLENILRNLCLKAQQLPQEPLPETDVRGSEGSVNGCVCRLCQDDS